MGIIRNLRKDFEEGLMDNLRSVTYEETGTNSPFVTEDLNNPPENRGLKLQVNKRIDDLTRISKLLINKPGLKFFANEAILKQKDITEKLRGNNKKTAGNIIRRIGGTVKHLAQVVGSTLAQVPVNGTGTHFVRGFRTDTYLQDNKFNSGFSQFFGAGGIEGAKYPLRGKPVPLSGLITNSEVPKRNTTVEPGLIGINHIGVEGKITTETDISFYNNNLPYYGNSTETNIFQANRLGLIDPNIEGIKNSSVLPYSIGIGKDDKGAIDVFGDSTKSNINLSSNLYNPFKTNRYFSTSTEENILSAQSGTPVPNPDGKNTLEILGVQTTATPGSVGRSNKRILGSITNKDNFTIAPFSTGSVAAAKYTTLSTAENIIAVQNNKGIFFKNSPENLSNNNIIVASTFYNRKNTYTGLSTEQNIINLQSGQILSSDGMLPLRDNSNLDAVIGTSRPIPSNFDSSQTFYDGVVSTIPSKPMGAIEDFRSQGDQFYFNAEGERVKVPLSSTQYTGREITSYAFNYNGTKINKETRVGLGNQGKVGRKRTSYRITDKDTRDIVNFQDVSLKDLDGTKESRDLIQLNFDVLTAERDYFLVFRAFLDTFDDSFNANWNSHKYLGRGEDFYTYGGFDRTITIGFKIAAATREEMKPLYRKAATLASVTAPSYGEGGRFMRGALAKVTVGDYLYKQPGIIESVQYTWQTDYPWEISFQNPEIGDSKGDQILPHVLDVNITFKVIHDFLPETGMLPFITNHTPITKNKDIYIPLSEDLESLGSEERKAQEIKLEKENENIDNDDNIEVEESNEPITNPNIIERNPVIQDSTDPNKYRRPLPKNLFNRQRNELPLNIENNQEFDFSNSIVDGNNLSEVIRDLRYQNTGNNLSTPSNEDFPDSINFSLIEDTIDKSLQDNSTFDAENAPKSEIFGITVNGTTATANIKINIPSLAYENSISITNEAPAGSSREETIQQLEGYLLKQIPRIQKDVFDSIQKNNQSLGFKPINFKDNNNDGKVDSNDVLFEPTGGGNFILDPTGIDPNNTSRPENYLSEFDKKRQKLEDKIKKNRKK